MGGLLTFDPTVHVDGVSVEDMLQEVKLQSINGGFSSGDSGLHQRFLSTPYSTSDNMIATPRQITKMRLAISTSAAGITIFRYFFLICTKAEWLTIINVPPSRVIN